MAQGKSKAFFLLKTKSELLLAEERNQLEIEPTIKKRLENGVEFKQNSLVGATVTKNSPAKVVDVKLVDSPELFLEFAF